MAAGSLSDPVVDVLPLARGAIATLAIFTFLFFWNEFTWPYIVINEAAG